MSDLNPPSILARDHWVAHPEGRIFARSWTPAGTESASEPAIVLLHDSLGCVELWRDFPAELSAATGRRVIAYDRLGFGKADAREGRPAALDFIGEEARRYFPTVREQLGLGRFIVFGHSVGGCMAIHCAAGFGADCVALITESAQTFPEDLTLTNIAAAKAQFADAAQLQRLQKYHGDKARWVLEAWTDNWLDPEFTAWTLAPVLPRVSCPVLAIHGQEDEYGTTRHPKMIGELSSGPARVEILPDTNHVPHRERPAVVLELVAGFVRELV